MIRKQSIIAGLLLTTYLMLHCHDFHYYEQKTRELLPLLGIDRNEITFIATHQTPLILHRISNPRSIYIHLERLEQLTEATALFECAFQAKCTTIDWGKIRYKPLSIHPYTIRTLITIYVLSVFTIKKYSPSDWFKAGWVGLILSLPFAIGVEIPLIFIDAAQKNNVLLAILQYYCTEKLIDTIYHLLENPNTAHLAFAGFEANYKTLPTHHYYDCPHGNTIPDREHTKSGLLRALNKWIRNNPDQWLEIKTTLSPQTIALVADIAA